MVSKGDKIQVEKLKAEKGDKIIFDRVLFSGDEKSYQLGKPFIAEAVVEGKVLQQARSKKIVVFKYKAKSKYRRKQGHRQNYTEVEITKA